MVTNLSFRRWLLLVLILTTYLIHELWTVLPASDSLYSPFPFSDQQVSKQYYVFGACEYLIWVVLMYVIFVLFTEARDVMKWFLIFQVFELIEYFLTYNKPLYFVPVPGEDIGINITNIKIVVMFVLIIKKYFTWNPGK